MGNNLSLLSTLNLVETPYIKVTLGDYTFGVFSKTEVQIVKALSSLKCLWSSVPVGLLISQSFLLG